MKNDCSFHRTLGIASAALFCSMMLNSQSLFKKIQTISPTSSSLQEEINENKEIAPALGNNTLELFKQLPQILSIHVLLDPEEDKERDLYLQKLDSIEQRLWELKQESNNSSDALSDLMDKKTNYKQTDLLGLTPEEMEELGNEKTSEKRRKELEEKMAMNMTGLTAAQINEMNSMSEEEQEAYIARNANFNKLKHSEKSDKGSEIERYDELALLIQKINTERQLSESRLQTCLTNINKESQALVDELKAGYNKLYQTSSITERDAISDQLKIRNDRYRVGTIEQWRSAHSQYIQELRKLCEECFKQEGKNQAITMTACNSSYALLEEAIKLLRNVIYFEPNKESFAAHFKVIQNNVAHLWYDEMRLQFTSSASSSQSSDQVDCGSFINSYFVVSDSLSHIYLSHQGKLIGPFSKTYDAMEQMPKGHDRQYPVPATARYESAGGKRTVVVKEHQIILDDGTVFEYPIAINRCNEFVYWLIYDGRSIIEYSYRL